MVPKFVASSSDVMPMPLSSMVRVLASWSTVIVIFSSSSPSAVGSLATRRWRHFSSASDALLSSSLKNTSRSV